MLLAADCATAVARNQSLMPSLASRSNHLTLCRGNDVYRYATIRKISIVVVTHLTVGRDARSNTFTRPAS
jgi:hypothetical protein